jgi:hypothetical protein
MPDTWFGKIMQKRLSFQLVLGGFCSVAGGEDPGKEGELGKNCSLAG